MLSLKHSQSKINELSSVIFLSHGAGPLPLLENTGHEEMARSLRQMTECLIQPKAIIVISAHWEAAQVTISSAAHPDLIYDYFGFPEAAYEITYPAPGNPLLAQRVFELLKSAGIKAKLDATRGFDHGLFVPLKLMFPNADIPCLQLSLIKSLDAQAHVNLGKALTQLRDEQVLIVGSGFTFHNMSAFLNSATQQSQAQNLAFESWLGETCMNTALSEAKREELLVQWEHAPAARYCHPREEHLLPLHVCYGAAGTAAQQVLRFEVLGKMTSSFLW